MTAVVASAEACVPNFSGPGRRRRKAIAWLAGVAAVVVSAVNIALDVAWPWQAVVIIPAATCAISGLQVRRNTCVARAHEGVVEHDDFSTTPASPSELARSRTVASGVKRDGIAIAVVVGALAMALSALL